MGPNSWVLSLREEKGRVPDSLVLGKERACVTGLLRPQRTKGSSPGLLNFGE